MHTPLEPLITADEAAETLNVSRAWLYRRVRSGDLSCVRLGDAGNRAPLRFRPQDLAAVIHEAAA